MNKIVLPLLCLISGSLCGQTASGKKFSMGFLAGTESQMIGGSYIKRIDDNLYSITGHNTVGASFGCFGQWALSRSISLRPQLLLAFNNNYIRLFSGDQQVGEVRYRFSDLELPLHLVATNQVGNLPIRASVLVGGRVSWNFSSPPADRVIGLYPQRVGLDIGLGAEFQCKKFKLKPEVVYSYGVNNIHDVSDLPFDWSIGRMVRDKLTFRILIWK